MSSFSEDTTTVAAPEIQESCGYGAAGGVDNVPSPEGVVSTNPNVGMNDQNIDSFQVDVQASLSGPAPEATVYQPEAVVLADVMHATLPEAAVAGLAAPEAVYTSAVVKDSNEVVVAMDAETQPPPPRTPPTAIMNVESNQVVEYPNNGIADYQNNGIGNSSSVANTNTNTNTSVGVGVGVGVGEAMKRKRGRPRKHPEAASTHLPAVSSSPSQKKGRGRPAGSTKKLKPLAPSPCTNQISPAFSGSSTGAGFVPYFITVRSGEYVQPKLLSLSQVDKQVVCVLSATGTISNVTLQQPLSSGGTVTYQGCFEILSLSGSFLLSESGGRRSITGGLSVSLLTPSDGIFGGGVAGPLIADSDVQMVVGTFLASEQHLTIPRCNEVLTTPQNLFSSVGETPLSRAHLSESSGAGGSPFNHSNGGFNNGNQHPVPKVAWM